MGAQIIAQAAIQGLLMGAIYALIALSMTLLFSVAGLLNFAHGDFMTLAMFAVLVLLEVFGIDPYVSAPILFVVFAAFGALLFRCLIRPVLPQGLLVGAQMTLGMVIVLQNGLLLAFGGEYRSVRTVLSNRNLALGGFVLPWPLVVGAVVAGVLAAALYYVLARTDFGRQVRAITQNRAAAALMGIRIARVQTQAFALGLGLLGLTGPLVVSQVTVTPAMGFSFTLLALIVMVFGGVGSFVGSMVGGLLIGMAESVGSLLLGGTIGAMIPYLILLLVLLFRPHGLFGES
jgi:branched-chain amino acid transport system permease protein